MVTVHMWVGSVLVLAYVVLTVVNFMQMRGSRTISWAHTLSMAAAGLLLIQILLGFNLLGGDHSITPFHYIFALLSLVTVGIEHGMVKGRELASDRARIAAFASTGTMVLVLIAYAIAESA